MAIGFGTSGTAIEVLAPWADFILLMDMGYLNWVPLAERSKVRDFSIGADRWSNPYHPELQQIVKQKISDWFSSEKFV